VREQAEIIAGRLRELRRATFRRLTSDCAGTYEVVARFLAVLDLYRDGRVSLDQLTPLGELYVTWTDGAGTGSLAAAGMGTAAVATAAASAGAAAPAAESAAVAAMKSETVKEGGG
jgi:hypothetical protein